MAGEISYHLQQLQSMDAAYVCGFAHECSYEVEPEQCPPAVQNIRLCCAHSARNILYNAIIALEDAGRIDGECAQNFRNRICEQSINLVRLDITASSEFRMRLETQDGKSQLLESDHPIVFDQRSVLHALSVIRKELMQLCL